MATDAALSYINIVSKVICLHMGILLPCLKPKLKHVIVSKMDTSGFHDIDYDFTYIRLSELGTVKYRYTLRFTITSFGCESLLYHGRN